VNAPEGAVVTYKTEEDAAYSEVVPTFTDAGSYTVYYKVTKNNFNEVTGYATVEIAQLEAVLAWTNTELTYNGSEQAPTASVSNLVEGDTCDVTVSGAETNVGSYTATATELSNQNYKLPADATQAFTIAKATPDLGTVSAEPLACNQTLADLVLSRTDESIAGTLAVTSEEISEEGTVNYQFTPDDTYNYEIVTGIVSVKTTDHVYGKPDWNWANDASSATAKFTCSGCGDEKSVDAVIDKGVMTQEPGLATAGTMTYTATATFNGVEYTATKEVAIAPTFIIKQNHTLLVNGKIGVNYLVQFAEGVENPVMTAWHTKEDGEWVKTEITGKQNLNNDGEWDGRYRFTYLVAAPEMADTIFCTYAATLNGAEVSTSADDPFTYSVKEYLDGRMQKSKDEKMRTLAAYMATYGSYAQRYFDVNTDNLADANVASLYGTVTVDRSFVDTTAEEQIIEGSVENATAAVTSHSLVLDAATTLRYIVTLDDESVLPNAYLAYRVAGTEDSFKYVKIVRNKREDGSIRLIADIVGIKAPDMTDAYEAYICVKNGSAYEQISLTTIYSPECYIASRLEKSSNETLKNTLVALMMYCRAARDYFGLDAE
jgi:hypothetical protein